MGAPVYDVFISHASEDKRDVAEPLAGRLKQLGFAVWLDQHELRLGDQLRRKINQGLSSSRYGIVILSEAFFSKSWPMEELDALMGRESINTTVVLPIRHGLSHDQVKKYHPTVANKLSICTSLGIEKIVEQVTLVLGAPLSGQSSVPGIPVSGTSSESVGAEASHIFDTLADLEKRATICLTQTMQLNEPDANENSCPTIAANIASHEEYGAVDRAIREYSMLVHGRIPAENEWRSHTQHLMLLESQGRGAKTHRQGYQIQLEWIRLSRIYVRKLSSMRLPP